MPMPYTFGFGVGLCLHGMIEYNINSKKSISFGFKNSYNSDMGGYMIQKNNCIISEFKHYFNKDKKSVHFIGTYFKLRDHSYYNYSGYREYSNYYEKSIGFGLFGGEKFIFDKNEHFFMTLFFGGGYFIGFDKQYYRTVGFSPGYSNSPHNNLGFFGNKIDIRIGALFGFQFKK